MTKNFQDLRKSRRITAFHIVIYPVLSQTDDLIHGNPIDLRIGKLVLVSPETLLWHLKIQFLQDRPKLPSIRNIIGSQLSDHNLRHDHQINNIIDADTVDNLFQHEKQIVMHAIDEFQNDFEYYVEILL